MILSYTFKIKIKKNEKKEKNIINKFSICKYQNLINNICSNRNQKINMKKYIFDKKQNVKDHFFC